MKLIEVIVIIGAGLVLAALAATAILIIAGSAVVNTIIEE